MKNILMIGLAILATALSAEAEQRWDEWRTTHAWPGLEYRVRRTWAHPNQNGKYLWDVEFRNNYSERINFSFDFTEPNTDPSTVRLSWGRMQLNPGRVDGSWKLLTSTDQISVWAGKVRFGNDEPGPYASPR
jgi:hypothetical protein